MITEYHKIIDYGILIPESYVELLEGRIVEINPQGVSHAATTQRISDYLKAQLTRQAHVRMQLLVILLTSEPEPDIAIIKIDPQAYGNRHPSPKEIFFLIEISDTILKIDRE